MSSFNDLGIAVKTIQRKTFAHKMNSFDERHSTTKTLERVQADIAVKTSTVGSAAKTMSVHR